MRRTALLLALIVTGISSLSRAAGPVRVVSQTVGTDELLLAVAAPEQVAALSHLACEPEFSAVAEEARQYPLLAKNTDLEGILKHAPSLLLCADYSREEVVAQARRAGLKVIVLTRYRTLEDAYDNLRLIARELGPDAEARAEQVIARCRQRVDWLAERLKGVRPVKVIAPSTYGVISGAETTFQDKCDHAGAENLAATLGGLKGHMPPPNEQMLGWPIDYVVVAGESVEQALKVFKTIPPYQYMASVRENRAVLLKPCYLSSVSHHRIDGYEQLARQLHPGRFQ